MIFPRVDVCITSLQQVTAESIVYMRLADSIIHILFFELLLFLFEPGLDLRCLQVEGSLPRGLPSFGVISFPRGLPSFEARSFRLLQGGGEVKLMMLSSICCNKFLTLWDLVSSLFEVSFWAEALES